MSLKVEIEKKSKEIQTDSYSMSIGELINMYKELELQIQPDFQRFFRWSTNQKTQLIESILLGIPIPPIFVSQGKNGVWDVIDGLQRLSTIFEFTGILRDENGDFRPPSKLQATKFLPSLKDKMWNCEDEENSFTDEQRIDFKRAKLNINIIKRNSDTDAKYELFQRLNTGGTALTPQEIRNCLMIMLDRSFFELVSTLNENTNFQNCIPFTEKQISEQEDMEVVLRFLVYRITDLNTIKGNEDVGQFLTDQMISIIERNDQNYLENEAKVFHETFEYLDILLGENSFKKFEITKNKFSGAFSISAFEVLITGISRNIETLKLIQNEEIVQKIKDIYQNPKFLEITKSNARPITRFKKLTELSLEYFS